MQDAVQFPLSTHLPYEHEKFKHGSNLVSHLRPPLKKFLKTLTAIFKEILFFRGLFYRKSTDIDN